MDEQVKKKSNLDSFVGFLISEKDDSAKIFRSFTYPEMKSIFYTATTEDLQAYLRTFSSLSEEYEICGVLKRMIKERDTSLIP